MIPTASAAYLHHVNREFVELGGQQDELLGAAGRTRHRPEVIAENP
jgi:hypothetical protein